ncbi:MAG TPA: DUF4232 domain-containing protein [Candidatus Saccharimonadia bacterium]|jgi:hypothetical protein|nr:DUF4232 domain-containing protein [Candidatus Saccharimonadia bacterium]
MKTQWSGQQLAVVTVLVAAVAVLGGYSLSLSGRIGNSKPAASISPSPTAAPAASASGSPVASAKPSPATLPCHTQALSATVATANSAAGTSYQTLTLTNKSKTSCTLAGFPGISLVDASGTQLPPAAIRNGSSNGTLTLTPGASAYAAIGFPNPGNFDPGTCSADSTSMMIYPPDETTAFTIPDVKNACPGFSTTALSASTPG